MLHDTKHSKDVMLHFIPFLSYSLIWFLGYVFLLHTHALIMVGKACSQNLGNAIIKVEWAILIQHPCA